MSLAPFIRILGRGPGRARSLTMAEAAEAMEIVLSGRAAPQAVGAMLMLMRMKGETPDEIAGFTLAARRSLPGWSGQAPGLDWPSYAAGRSRGAPWFLLAAKLVAGAGVPVLLHGWNGAPQGRCVPPRRVLSDLGIAQAGTLAAAQAELARSGIAYLALESLSPALFDLLQLRGVLGLRSCVNTVLRVLNPAGAPASVQGVFHPSYRGLQTDACALLGQPRLTVLKGGGGEFERHPGKEIALFGLRGGAGWGGSAPALINDSRRLGDGAPGPEAVTALWQGCWHEPFAEAAVIGTAALALEAAGRTDDGLAMARGLWSARHKMQAA